MNTDNLQINFRVYHSKTSSVYDVVCLNCGTKRDVVVANYKDSECCASLPWDECVILQCTGLYDIHGNLIYAGDLIKVPDNWEEFGMMAGEVREVYYKDGGFRLRPPEDRKGCRGHWLEDNKTFEIVGNAYTHK